MYLSHLPFTLLGRKVRIKTDHSDHTGEVISFDAGPPFLGAPENAKYSILLKVGATYIEHHNLTADTEAWLVDTDPDS